MVSALLSVSESLHVEKLYVSVLLAEVLTINASLSLFDMSVHSGFR